MDDTQINHDSVKNLESWNQYLQEPLALIPNANSRYAFINLALQPKLIIKVRINNISKNEENKSGAFKQAALVYKVMYSNLEKFNKAHSLKINDDNNKSAHDDNKITIESIIENVEHDYSDFSKEYYEPKTYVKANYNFKFDFPLTEKQFKLTKNPKAFDIKSEYITDNYFNKREKHTEDLFSYILSKINADSITSKITFDTHTAKKIYIGNSKE